MNWNAETALLNDG